MTVSSRSRSGRCGTVRDPEPANITGEKVSTRSHSIEWRINVSHVLVALLALYALLRFDLLAALVEDGAGEGNDEGTGGSTGW